MFKDVPQKFYEILSELNDLMAAQEEHTTEPRPEAEAQPDSKEESKKED